jgi:hypothetical protein
MSNNYLLTEYDILKMIWHGTNNNYYYVKKKLLHLKPQEETIKNFLTKLFQLVAVFLQIMS